MALDLDDPRPPYIQVANDLRAAILTRKFAPGEKLPSGAELAKHYGIARMTVQQALRILKDEGLVVARQGSGVFVRARTERPVGLRPHIERAFEAEQVTLDFAGFSGETLAGALGEPLDKVRTGRLTPQSIAVRILVPDPTRPWALPSRKNDGDDDPQFRQRADGITRRSLGGILDAVHELADLGLVPQAQATVRVHGLAPTFKVYLLNDHEMFFGFYPVVEHAVTIQGERHPMWDLMGKDAVLFHHTTDDADSSDAAYVEQAKLWFDSVWSSVATEWTP
jgi:DNA-binding transcriptional regulator YhcF (GntR family)